MTGDFIIMFTKLSVIDKKLYCNLLKELMSYGLLLQMATQLLVQKGKQQMEWKHYKIWSFITRRPTLNYHQGDKLRKIGWAGHKALMGRREVDTKFLIRNRNGKMRPLWKSGCRWEDNIKSDRKINKIWVRILDSGQGPVVSWCKSSNEPSALM